MGYTQVVLIDQLGAVEEQVEVDRAGPPAGPAASDTAEPTLDVEEQLEQRARGQRRLELRDRVQERGLLRETQGSVSRMRESRRASISSAACRIVGSRSPRFAPRPT